MVELPTVDMNKFASGTANLVHEVIEDNAASALGKLNSWGNFSKGLEENFGIGGVSGPIGTFVEFLKGLLVSWHILSPEAVAPAPTTPATTTPASTDADATKAAAAKTAAEAAAAGNSAAGSCTNVTANGAPCTTPPATATPGTNKSK